MLPTLAKLAEDVAKIIKTPGQQAMKLASTEAIKAGGKAATSSITSSIEVQRKTASFKARNIINNDDVATACALVDILYDSVLETTINGVSLRRRSGDMRSIPLSYLHIESLLEADRILHATVDALKRARVAFDSGFAPLLGVLLFSKYMDIKSLAQKMISTSAADGWLVKDALRTCENGVEICDRGIAWAGQHDLVVNEWLKAHRLPATAL
jgi:hypothetical protein